ncbi:MAG: DUF4199 domain-containing protein [Alistipes sp.]|jgi:hypothetical protein|nr:DUF4199 domain-containing protein [Alistipes sp.]
MTKKQFWRNASNQGMICGCGLLAVSVVAWVFGFAPGSSWNWPELLRFALIAAVIWMSGRRSAALVGPEGWPYGRAVGFIFATMMFAGIVAGVGEFLMTNFIARDYYDALNAGQIDTALAMYRGTPFEGRMEEMRGTMESMLSNPFMLIFGSVVNYVIKGGFLGLILGAFLYRKPDFFAAGGDTPDNG